jgi:hypothetical protein
VLRGLGEAGDAAAVGVVDAGPVTGQVVAVGRDVVVLRGRTSGVVVAASAITWVRAEPGARLPAGTQPVSSDVSLLALLAELAGLRAEVSVGLAGSREVVRGTLVAVGRDVLRLRQDGAPAAEVALAAAAVRTILVGAR